MSKLNTGKNNYKELFFLSHGDTNRCKAISIEHVLLLNFYKRYFCFRQSSALFAMVLSAEKIRLLSSPGVQEYIRDNESRDAHQLAFQRTPFEGLDSRDISNQVAARQKAKTKLPSWFKTTGVVFPEALSMEQCSSESTAIYKAGLIAPDQTIADLTGGLGVDSWALAQKARHLDYVEQQTYLCDLALENFATLKVRASVNNCSLESYLEAWKKKPTAVVFCDPARRNENQRKVFLLEDCSPDILEIAPGILKSHAVFMVKLSPLFDISRLRKSFGHHLREIHVVAVKNECKELLILLKPEEGDCLISAVNLDTTEPAFNVRADTQPNRYKISDPLVYLYEPNAAIMKSGKQDFIMERYDVAKLADNSHLYTSSTEIHHFPGRSFRINSIVGLHKNELLQLIPGKKANISCRNFPLRPEEVAKKIGFSFGGDQYLFATTLSDGKKVVIHCERY